MSRFDTQLPPLLGALLVAAGPHIFRLPPWIAGWCFLLWGYALAGAVRSWPRPGRPVLWILATTGFSMAILTFGGGFDSDAYVALLSVMASLKPLEIRSYRDKIITAFLAYFMVLANLFYSDTLLMTLYLFLSVLVTTAVLVHINHPGGAVKAKLRLAGILMMQAIPLALILFVLFPRIQGGLWGITRKTTGTSGFSDSMSPGSVSNMVENTAVAFRVRFEGPAPAPELRYWRGVVFAFFDGREWRRMPGLHPLRDGVPGEKSVDYTVTLEPHRDRWLFLLEMPGNSPDRGVLLSDLTAVARRPVNERRIYRMRSFLDYHTGPLRQWERISLQVPGRGNNQARELAREWARTGAAPREIVARALDYFQRNDFVYTFQPPLLGPEPVDDFLFNTRKGYCEHFASAFAFLMRAADIPARVVGGYQGGEMNPYGDYLIVRQSDAHAWTEVWFQDTGWTRVDPTLAVAPERARRGVQEVLSLEDRARLSAFPDLGPLTDFLRSARLGWDSVNAYWTLWVMGYTRQDQESLLNRIGIRFDTWRGSLLTILLGLGLITGLTLLFAVGLKYRSGLRKDPAGQSYDAFRKKLARNGIEALPSQGPLDFAQEVIRRRPDLQQPVREITDLYIRLRYGTGEHEAGDGKAAFRDLKNRVQRFDPRKRTGLDR
ncbi:MAG: transglutaminase TgpA family protein [Thermodesulfobacteriota bacterium]